MVEQFNRKHSSKKTTTTDAATMKTIIATILAVVTAVILNSASNYQANNADQSALPTLPKVGQVDKEQTSDTEVKDTGTVKVAKKKTSPKKAKNGTKKPQNTKTGAVVKKSAPKSGGCELAYKYDWPADTARAVCMAESSGDHLRPNWSDSHHNCNGSFGLMQVACFWPAEYGYTVADLYDAEINMKIAYYVYKRGNSFSAWTTYTSGKYLQFL